MAKDKLICNCNRTMPLDGKALEKPGLVPLLLVFQQC